MVFSALTSLAATFGTGKCANHYRFRRCLSDSRTCDSRTFLISNKQFLLLVCRP